MSAEDEIEPPSRGLLDIPALLAAAPFLATAPRGQRQGVIVLPGLGADDRSTVAIRRFLASLGYDVHGWNRGRNIRGADADLPAIAQQASRLRAATGLPVSLVGWSRGGIMAREVAREIAPDIRMVITLGSPFAAPTASNVRTLWRLLYGEKAASPRPEWMRALARPIPVPATAIYTRSDGVVAWQACLEPEGTHSENIEVRTTISGSASTLRRSGSLPIAWRSRSAPGGRFGPVRWSRRFSREKFRGGSTTRCSRRGCVTAVDRDRGPAHEPARLRRKIERRPGHILRTADPQHRGLPHDDLADLLGNCRGHFRGKISRRDGVHGDVLLGKIFGHHPRDVQHSGLRGSVRIGLDSRHVHAVDRTDVDDTGEIVGAARRFQQLEQPLRQEEHRFDVEVHDLVPSRLREVLEAGAPGGSCIVDENIQPFLATLHFPGQPLDLVHSRQIRRYGDALPDARQLPGERIARIRLARRDVDLGAVLDIAASDHFADAPASAGDQRDLAAHTEQLLDLHRPSPWFPLRAGNLFRMFRRRATRPAPRLHLATRRFHRSADARRKTRRNAGSCRSTQRSRESSYFFSTLPRISSKLCCIRS